MSALAWYDLSMRGFKETMNAAAVSLPLVLMPLPNLSELQAQVPMVDQLSVGPIPEKYNGAVNDWLADCIGPLIQHQRGDKKQSLQGRQYTYNLDSLDENLKSACKKLTELDDQKLRRLGQFDLWIMKHEPQYSYIESLIFLRDRNGTPLYILHARTPADM